MYILKERERWREKEKQEDGQSDKKTDKVCVFEREIERQTDGGDTWRKRKIKSKQNIFLKF